MNYIIDEDLRDSLIGLIKLIQKATENEYLFLKNGKVYRFPYLDKIVKDLYELDGVN